MKKWKVLPVLSKAAVGLSLPMASHANFNGAVKICLDPGHGGTDSGAVGFGIKESDVDFTTCAVAKRDFIFDGAQVIMTRNGSEETVSLQGRCDIANNWGASRFISSHCNSGGGGNGTETYCQTGANSTCVDFRNKINAEMVAHLATYNRGTKTADIYTLRNISMPGIECRIGFIDNAADNTKISNTTWQQEAARAYLHGTQSHYGQTPHNAPAAIILDNTDARFSASSNWWTSTSSTQKYGADYRCHDTHLLSDCAQWTVPEGYWVVSAWWSAGTNRSSETPFIICSGDGDDRETIVNQQINGGKWNLIDARFFNTPTGCVKISCWAQTGYVVIADAIMLEPMTQ